MLSRITNCARDTALQRRVSGDATDERVCVDIQNVVLNYSCCESITRCPINGRPLPDVSSAGGRIWLVERVDRTGIVVVTLVEFSVVIAPKGVTLGNQPTVSIPAKATDAIDVDRIVFLLGRDARFRDCTGIAVTADRVCIGAQWTIVD
jgi:hypothetical protein